MTSIRRPEGLLLLFLSFACTCVSESSNNCTSFIGKFTGMKVNPGNRRRKCKLQWKFIHLASTRSPRHTETRRYTIDERKRERKAAKCPEETWRKRNENLVNSKIKRYQLEWIKLIGTTRVQVHMQVILFVVYTTNVNMIKSMCLLLGHKSHVMEAAGQMNQREREREREQHFGTLQTHRDKGTKYHTCEVQVVTVVWIIQSIQGWSRSIEWWCEVKVKKMWTMYVMHLKQCVEEIVYKWLDATIAM